MEKITQYEYLKDYIKKYTQRKSYNIMMLKVFNILLTDLESEIISEHMKRKKLK
jgi:hypothetical protein